MAGILTGLLVFFILNIIIPSTEQAVVPNTTTLPSNTTANIDTVGKIEEKMSVVIQEKQAIALSRN